MSETREPSQHAPPIIFEAFDGLNTEASRAGIQDTQCSWLDGFFPIGPNNARSIYGIGASIFNAALVGSGQTIAFFGFANIFFTPFAIVVLSDGSVWQVITTTAANEQIAPPGTITNLDEIGMCQWGSSYVILVANQTDGYFIWDGTTFYKPGDVFTPEAPATVPTGLGGSFVSTYQSSVFVVIPTSATAFTTSIAFSAPGSLVDFATADGGGVFGSSDPFLRVTYVGLVPTNGFLYIIADSSIYYLSNLVRTGSPVTATFTITNVDNEMGTPWAGSIQVWNRDIMFANDIGVHQCSGGSARKISDALDGIYNSVPNFGGNVPSAAKSYIFGKKTYALLQTVLDPFSGPTTYCATPIEMDNPTFLTLPEGAMPNLAADNTTLFFSGWFYLPADGNNEGIWFSNMDDDSDPVNAGIQIGIFNPATSPTYQIIVTAYDSTNTWIVQAGYAQSVWTGWVWVAVSIDTLSETIQCYVNTGSGDTALTPAVVAWNSTNPVANVAGHTWHINMVDGDLIELEDGSGWWLFEDGSGMAWG